LNDHQNPNFLAWSLAGLGVIFCVALTVAFGWHNALWILLGIGLAAAIGYGAMRLYFAGLQPVPPDKVGIAYRKYRRLRQSNVHDVRVFGYPGLEARVLTAGGIFWLPPFLWRVEFHPLTYIRPEYVGLVIAKVGQPRSTNTQLARHIECNHFQDGAAFLTNGGEQGPQPALLAGGGYYHVNPYLFTVQEIEQIQITPGNVGVVTAKIGQNLPVDRPVARHIDCDYFQNATAFLRNGGEQGPQPMLLTGGNRYNINPYVFTVEERPQVQVTPGNVGVVTAKVGRNLPQGQPVASHVECDYFQNGPAFLLSGGEQGPQPMLLTGGNRYNINPYMFAVEEIPQVSIRTGDIGVVVARVGENLPSGRPFGRHVECDYFQDGPAFLRQGGQQGPQLALLTGGNRYDINPHMFEVITQDNVDDKRSGLTRDDLQLVSLLEGNTGVVVVREGAPAATDTEPAPHVPGHDRFQLPWVFLEKGGQQGAQAETLPGGANYAINPWFARVVRIPTRELILKWDDKGDDEDGDRYDSALEPIKAMVEGHGVRVHLTQTLRIPPEAAPALVKRFGEQETENADQFGFVNKRPAPVKRFVERILGSLVSGYFSTVSAQYKINDFVDNQHEVQTDLEDTIQRKMEEWNVIASNTTLVQITFEDEKFNDMRREMVASRARHQVLEQEERNNEIVQRTIRRTEDRELETHRKRREIDVGTEIQVLINLLGKDEVRKERFIGLLTKFGVPQVVAGTGNVGALTDFISPAVLMDVVNKVMNEPRGTIISSRVDRVPPAHPDSIQIEGEDRAGDEDRADREEPTAEPAS
jgi:ribosomal protein L35AE/L33A